MIFEEYTHQHETPRLDARNVLVYDPPRESDNSCPINLPFGTIPFAALAFSGALWAHIFVVESEPGKEIYKILSQHLRNGFHMVLWIPDWPVCGGLSMRIRKSRKSKPFKCKDTPGCPVINDVITVLAHHDLDLTAKEVLLEALLEYEGTVVLVAHDRYILDRLPSQVIEVGHGAAVRYLGNYEEYLAKKLAMEAHDGGAAVRVGGTNGRARLPASLQPASVTTFR